MREKVLKNVAECKLCHDVVESKHVHDYRSCKCGEIAVDGGLEYIRRTAKDLDNIIEKSEVLEQSVSQWLTENVVKKARITSYAAQTMVGNEILQGLRWGAILDIEGAVRKEIPDLTIEQYDKLKMIILRELTGEK